MKHLVWVAVIGLPLLAFVGVYYALEQGGVNYSVSEYGGDGGLVQGGISAVVMALVGALTMYLKNADWSQGIKPVIQAWTGLDEIAKDVKSLLPKGSAS